MTLVEKFVTKVIAESSFEELDRIYLTNRVLALVGDGVLEVETDQDAAIGFIKLWGLSSKVHAEVQAHKDK